VKPVIVHPQAKAELNHAVGYYEYRIPGLGLAFLTKVEHAIQKIQQSPQTWPRHLEPQFRKYTLERFPYLIFYMERLEDIWIVAIAHAKRHPHYWKTRRPPK
jgi:toxin ParE1/3/4